MIDEIIGPALDSYLKTSVLSRYLLSASVGWSDETMQDRGVEPNDDRHECLALEGDWPWNEAFFPLKPSAITHQE